MMCEMPQTFYKGPLLLNLHILNFSMHASSRTAPSDNYTLAGSPVWKELQRSKPITQFSLREREFIKDSLTSDWDQDFTGTRVIYVEPEGSDHISPISDDENDEGLHNNQPNAPGKGK